MLAIDVRTWEHRLRTTTDVGRGEKGCAVGASSDTPSYSQAERMLDELRSMRRTIEQLERTMTRERGARHDPLLTGMLGSVALGLFGGLVVLLAMSRIVPALLGS
jgi:hypothetical protein